MQKLSIEIVERMCKSHLNRCEIDFLLCISRYQDDRGKVTGVYYKDIASEMGFSIPQFYAAKRSLEEKGFIQCEKNNYYDHDITILENDYLDLHSNPEENLKRKPYINTRHEIFYSKEFQKLKPGAKLLAMLFMRVTRLNKGSYTIGVKKFFQKYQELLGVQERILRVYLTQLKEFFSIGIVKGLYRVRPKKYKVFRQDGKSEKDNFNEHEIQTECRRRRIEVICQEDVEEVRTLVKQYRERAAFIGEKVLDVIKRALSCSVDPVEDIHSPSSALKPKLVHLWVKRLLVMGVAEKPLEQANTGSEKQEKKPGKSKFHNFTERQYNMAALEDALLKAQVQ